MDQQQSNKPHRATKDTKTAKKKLHTNGHNAKAFAVNAPGKLQRQALRSSDVCITFYSYQERENLTFNVDERKKISCPNG